MKYWRGYVPTGTEAFLFEPIDIFPLVGAFTNLFRNLCRDDLKGVTYEAVNKFLSKNQTEIIVNRTLINLYHVVWAGHLAVEYAKYTGQL